MNHRHIHLGANGLSTLMGIVLAVWIWDIFWIRQGAPPVRYVFWACLTYMALEPVTAALTVMSKDRWRSVLLDFGMAVVLLGETCIVMYDEFYDARLGVVGMRAEIARYFFATAALGLFNGFLITMIANTRAVTGPIPIGR